MPEVALSAEVFPKAAAQAGIRVLSGLTELHPFPRLCGMRAQPLLPLTGLVVG